MKINNKSKTAMENRLADGLVIFLIVHNEPRKIYGSISISTAKDVVNYTGYVGSNLLNSDFKQVNVDMVRGLVEQNAYIVEVRERGEYANGHI